MANAIQLFVTLDGEYQKLARDARDQLRALGVQPPKTAAVVRLADIDRALRLYEEGDLSREQLEEWAETLEMNDHVEYEHDSEQAVADLLFSLSSPEINGPITLDVVRQLRESLNGK